MKIILCFIGTLCLAGAGLLPQMRPFNFQHITIEDGLSQNIVYCVFRDTRGFIWLATDDGLNRFDGYAFTVYEPKPGRANCLSHNRVSSITEDSSGTFWIGTLGGGLNRFDPTSETFQPFRSSPAPNTLSHDSVRTICKDQSGRIWIGTENGLNLLNRDGRTFTRYLHDPQPPQHRSPSFISSITESRDRKLWIGTSDGLVRFDPAVGTFSRYHSVWKNGRREKLNQINTVFEDTKGNVWLGSESGLLKWDPASGTLVCRESVESESFNIFNMRILKISQDNLGHVWLGTERGLFLASGDRDLAFYFEGKSLPPRYLIDAFVIDIHNGPPGILWVATYIGVFKCNLEGQKFSYYSGIPPTYGRPKPGISVLSVCEDRHGIIWIGTYRQGLIRYDRTHAAQVQYLQPPSGSRGLHDNTVTALAEDGTGTLWIGMANGIQSFDTDRMTIGPFRPIEPGADGHADGVTRILESPSGFLWIGTENGLFGFDRRKQTFTRFLQDTKGPQSIGRGSIMSLCEDRTGRLWIGTYGEGLNCYDPVSRAVSRFRHRDDDPNSLSCDKVYCVTEDGSGTIWVGTNSGGLDRFEPKTRIFTHWTKEDGLPNNVIFGILEDRRGFLWLSTNRGLSRLDPRGESFKSFTAKDGLQGNEFFPNSYYRSKANELFFGGPNGLTSFFPEQIVDNSFVPPVVVTGVTLHNSMRTLGGDLSQTTEIRLPHSDTVVTFSFASLCFVNPARNRYAYRFDPLTRDWIQIGNKHEVTMSQLKPGRYVFRVKGTNNDGLWNERGASISVRISPPWWQSWWCRTLQLLFLMGLFILWYRTRMRRLAARIRTEAAMQDFFNKRGLSERETEIIRLVLKGRSNKEIEQELFIAIGTVKNHIYNIYQKLDVQNRTQLITLFKNMKIM